MQIKKDTKVKVQYRPELGSGAVLQVTKSPVGYTQVDKAATGLYWNEFLKDELQENINGSFHYL